MKKGILIITRRSESSVQRGQKLAKELGYNWGEDPSYTMQLKDFNLFSEKDAVVLCLDEQDKRMFYCEYEYFYRNYGIYPPYKHYTIMDIRDNCSLMETE